MSKLKRAVIIFSSIFLTMFVIPLISVNFAQSDTGMLIVLMLFFVVNPVLAIFVGVLAGKDIKHFWSSPLILAVLFWIFSSVTYETAFPVVYSAIYFLICTLSETVTYFIKKKPRD